MAEMVNDWICGVIAVTVSPATKLKSATDVTVKPRQGHPAVFVRREKGTEQTHCVRFCVDRKEGEGYCFTCTRAHTAFSLSCIVLGGNQGQRPWRELAYSQLCQPSVNILLIR